MLEIKTKNKVKMKQDAPIIQIKKLSATDKISGHHVFAAVSAAGQTKLFSLQRNEKSNIDFCFIKDLRQDSCPSISQPFQQRPLITLPNGAIVCAKRLADGGSAIGLWNVNNNQIDKNKGCVAGCTGGCSIF